MQQTNFLAVRLILNLLCLFRVNIVSESADGL